MATKRKRKAAATKSRKRCVIVDDANTYFVVGQEFFQTMSRSEALGFGTLVWLELHQQLTADALAGEESFIGNMKVITGLRNSLDAIESHHPMTTTQIKSLDLSKSGLTIFRC